nr:hypothetical protein [Microbacterium lemovicicum]
MSDLSRDEQETLANELADGDPDTDEWQEQYNSLDADLQEPVDQEISDYADGATGSVHWDSDERWRDD